MWEEKYGANDISSDSDVDGDSPPPGDDWHSHMPNVRMLLLLLFFFFALKNIRFQALLLLIGHLHGSFDFPESHLNLRLFNGIQDWVLLINRDNERQRAMPPQRPYSDAYLSGLPPKRRQVWNYEFSILKFIAMIVLILRKVLKW